MPKPQLARMNPAEAPLPCSDAGGWGSPAYYSTIQCADIDGDGRDELLARGAAGMITWKFDNQSRAWVAGGAGVNGPGLSDAAGWNQPRYYETIQLADIDGDGRAELLARGAGGVGVWKWDASQRGWISLPGPALSDAAGWNQPQYYETIQCADIDGDRQMELLARGAGGVGVWKWDAAQRGWISLPGPALSDAAGWNQPHYYETILCADIDGDRQMELLARSAAGISAWKWNSHSKSWETLPGGPAWSDAAGWNQPKYYRTIQCGDVDGDGRSELIARSAATIQLWKFDSAAKQWKQLPDGPPLSDAAGWDSAQYGETICAADIDGDDRAELVARGASGVFAWKRDAATGQWTQMNQAPGLPASAAWSDPKYYETMQFADVDGDGCKDLLMRGPDGVFAQGLDTQRGSVWTRLPRKGPIPKPTAQNVARVQANLSNMKELANQIHDSCQDTIQELFLLAQVDSKDWGTNIFILAVTGGFKLAGATPAGGAGAVLSAIFNYAVSRDQRGDIKDQFADVWQRFSKAFLLVKTEISQFQSKLADKSTLERTWVTLLPVDLNHPDALVLGDLASEDVPAENGARASEFNRMLLEGIAGFKYSLWQATLRQRWNIGSAVYPYQEFKSEQECVDFLRANVKENPWSYGTYAQPRPGEWEVTLISLFSRVGLPLQTFASKELCRALFQDDGYGTMINSDGIAARADVFNNWGLTVIPYRMPTGPPVV